MSSLGKHTQYFLNLGIEKKIVYITQLLVFASLFSSWSSKNTSIIENQSSFGSLVSFNAYAILLLLACNLAIVLLPYFKNKEVVPVEYKQVTQSFNSILTLVLTLSSLAILTKASWNIGDLQVEFGIYITMLCTLICVVYSLLVLRSPAKNVHPVTTTEPAKESNNVHVPNAPEAEVHPVLRNLSK